MALKTIKISEENYLWLLRLAAEMQMKENKRISFDNVIENFRGGRIEKKKIMDFAGIWEDMTNEEAEKLKKYLKKGWGKWKAPSL